MKTLMNKKLFYHFILSGTLAAVIFFGASGILTAHAADLMVSPAVIDGSGVPNDILNYTLTVTNTTGNQLNVFASVYELTPSGTEPFADPSGSNRPALLADWISVSRASMSFAPNETKTLPVSITINPYAAAGDYHAVVAFVEGGTRVDAETHLDGAPSALVNMSVASNLTASLIIDGFAAAKGYYSSFPVTFNYTIENNGDVASVPSGEIMFYDRTGHEINSIDANPDSVSISPGQKQSFTAPWNDGGGFGQYKAVLDLTYGAGDNKLENTALVWVLPWEKLLIIFGILFALMIFFAIWLHREYEKRHHRRRVAFENILNKHRAGQKNMDPVLDLRHPHE
jgi:hypothetical protein